MAYRTVNVKPETHDRLQIYRVAGRTFDDVLNIIMDACPPEDVFRRLLEEYQAKHGREPAHPPVQFKRIHDPQDRSAPRARGPARHNGTA